MAVLYPPLNTIRQLRPKPTPGEIYILEFLDNNLDDSYEVYFQSFLNGDRPDIVIMRKNSGVYIIEVKDWNLGHYRLTDEYQWEVKKSSSDWQEVTSPFTQVYRYKRNLYNLHVEGLLEKKIKNPKMMSIVNCGVYFHNATTSACKGFLKLDTPERSKAYTNNTNLKKISEFHSSFDIIGNDTLMPDQFNKIMEKRYMSRKSYLFSDELYESFKRLFQPPRHTKEQGSPITYSSEQHRIIESKSNSMQKIKGVAGSGKTLCLAKRAVNAHLRHKKNVLILTFNISLRNYIHDKINEVREDFNWSHFHVIHFHEFFKNQANNYGIPISSLNSWNDARFFENVIIREDDKYDTILIDEIQDYLVPWINIVVNYFLAENGEYVVYGDEKQNIYKRAYDRQEKKPYTKIPGQWNLLKQSYRITNDIARLAEAFQKRFFTEKYELDEIAIQKNLFEQSFIKYFKLERFQPEQVISIYKETAKELIIHDNDICIQSPHVEQLREIDFLIRNNSSQKTNTMFETKEVYKKLKSTFPDKSKFKREIENVRRNKKFNFWDNRGLLKMSTIHSFKGWEIDTLFLIIDSKTDEDMEEFTTDELIYTAITRCQTNLIIININNTNYDEFFKEKVRLVWPYRVSYEGLVAF